MINPGSVSSGYGEREIKRENVDKNCSFLHFSEKLLIYDFSLFSTKWTLFRESAPKPGPIMTFCLRTRFINDGSRKVSNLRVCHCLGYDCTPEKGGEPCPGPETRGGQVYPVSPCRHWSVGGCPWYGSGSSPNRVQNPKFGKIKGKLGKSAFSLNFSIFSEFLRISQNFTVLSRISQFCQYWCRYSQYWCRYSQ